MANKCVAIFGRADALEKDFDFVEAYVCAKILAKNKFKIINGGYEGTMLASSMGAFESKGIVIGVPCLKFSSRKPNEYLSKIIWAKDLFERQKTLVKKSDAFVAFEPKAGTLSEVSLIFALRKGGEKCSSPLCLVGEKWFKIMNFFEKERIIPKNLLKYTFFCENGSVASKTIIDFFSNKEDISGR